MTPPLVRVEASAQGLANALRSHLVAAGVGVAADGDRCDPDILIVPTLDCSPERCLDLTAHGSTVIVLAPIPRSGERQRYADAGAEYLPMTIDPRLLRSAIILSRLRRTAGREHSPG